MSNGAFGENFPYSNFHDLNMDWIIKIAKDFLDQYTHIQEVIANGEESLENLTTSGLAQLQEKADNLEALLQAWYDEHSQDIANQLADALADLNEWYNTHENYLDNTLSENIEEFNSAAEAKSQALLDSWPDDYAELVEGYNNLKNALSVSVNNEKVAWRIGGLFNEYGTENTVSFIINTTNYLPDDIHIITCAEGFSFRVFCYTENGTYLGYINSQTGLIVKTPSGIPYNTNLVDLTELKTKLTGIKFKIAGMVPGQSSGSISISESIKVLLLASDSQEYKKDNFEKLNAFNYGAISAEDGITYTNVRNRICTNFLQGNEIIKLFTDGKMFIYGWHKRTGFAGLWNGETFTNTPPYGDGYREIDLSTLSEDYLYRVCGYMQGDGTDQIAEAYLNYVSCTTDRKKKLINPLEVARIGAVPSATGLPDISNNRRFFIPELAGDEVIYLSNYLGKLYLYAYSQDGTYLGTYDGSDFVKSSSSFQTFDIIDLTAFPSTNKYLICGYIDPGSDTVTESDLTKIIIYRKSRNNRTYTDFVIATWNIGHFSGGINTDTTITDSDYQEKKTAYKRMINNLDADIMVVTEYSNVFATLQSGNVEARDVLFGNFMYRSIGKQANYSCNSAFSNLPLYGMADHIYECNQTAVITHTSAILATDYKYMHGTFEIDGETVHVIGTHCAFDLNNADVEIDQYEELINLCKDYKRVIILGDMNTAGGVSEFDLFKNAGYVLANHGYMGDYQTYKNSHPNRCLDNIMVKGLAMKKIEVISDPDNLSDHLPIKCTLTLAT